MLDKQPHIILLFVLSLLVNLELPHHCLLPEFHLLAYARIDIQSSHVFLLDPLEASVYLIETVLFGLGKHLEQPHQPFLNVLYHGLTLCFEFSTSFSSEGIVVGLGSEGLLAL